MAYQNGDVVNANDINKAIDDSTTAVNTANTAKTASDKASADVVKLGEQIGSKQGTTVTVGGVAQNAVAFTSDPQTQINNLHPIGSIYQSVVNTSPASLFGGSWERFGNGRVLVGVDENDADFANGKVGGEKEHILTIAELAKHNHNLLFGNNNVSSDKLSFSPPYSNNQYHTMTYSIEYAGGNQAHNNLQPYTTVYIWRRIA